MIPTTVNAETAIILDPRKLLQDLDDLGLDPYDKRLIGQVFARHVKRVRSRHAVVHGWAEDPDYCEHLEQGAKNHLLAEVCNLLDVKVTWEDAP